MKRKNFNASLYSAAMLIIAVVVSLCTTSCSDSITDIDSVEDDGEVILKVSFPNTQNNNTRTVTTPVSGINSIYMYAYQGTTRKALNVRYDYNGTSWNASGAKIMWPSSKAISIFGLTDSYLDVSTVKTENMKERYIEYYVSPVNAHDVWFGSALNQTKAKTGGNINIKFTRLVTRATISCKNSMTDYSVKISEIIIHNLLTTGRFTYSEKSASTGAWSWPISEYDNYPQKLKVDLAPGLNRDGVDGDNNSILPIVPPLTKKQLVTDSAFILIPQVTQQWKPEKDVETTTTANANHICYLEIKCQVFETEANGDLGACVWGDPAGSTDDEKYEPIYIPFRQTFSSSNNTKNVVIDLYDAYNEDGSRWTPRGTTKVNFSEGLYLEPIEEDDDIDKWDEQNGNAYAIEL